MVLFRLCGFIPLPGKSQASPCFGRGRVSRGLHAGDWHFPIPVDCNEKGQRRSKRWPSLFRMQLNWVQETSVSLWNAIVTQRGTPYTDPNLCNVMVYGPKWGTGHMDMLSLIHISEPTRRS